MRAFNSRKGKHHRYGRYDGIKAIIESDIEDSVGEFNIEDYYIENYKEGANYGQPIEWWNIEKSIKSYFGSYRALWRTHNEGRAFGLIKPYCEEDDIFALVRLADVKSVMFGKYVLLKKGGVFNIKTGNWYKKTEFAKAMSVYSNQKYVRGVAAFDYILFEIYVGNGDELDINHIHDVLNSEVEDEEDEIEDDDYCSITDIENEGDDE